MIRVLNLTPALLSIDPPSDKIESDNVGQVLAKVTKGNQSAADVQRTLLELEVARHQDAQVARQVSESAMRRAGQTVDLLPAYQGKDKGQHVNEVEEEAWRRAEKMPAIAARIATGQIRIIGAGKGKTRATRSKETQASA